MIDERLLSNASRDDVLYVSRRFNVTIDGRRLNMDENDTASTNANDYLKRVLGDNHDDVLAVSKRLSGGANIACIDNKFHDFGGVEAVRSLVEENVAAAQLKRAEKTVPAILQEWRRANADKTEEPAGPLGLQGDPFRQKGAFTDMLLSLFPGFDSTGSTSRDASMSLSQIQKLRTLRDEIDNASNDYEREIRQREYEKVAKAFNDNAMKDIRAKAEEGDAWVIAATIVSLGPTAVSETARAEFNAIYDELLGNSEKPEHNSTQDNTTEGDTEHTPTGRSGL